MSDNKSETFKVVLFGQTGVGKTSKISQFINQNFQDDLQNSKGWNLNSKSYTYGRGKF